MPRTSIVRAQNCSRFHPQQIFERAGEFNEILVCDIGYFSKATMLITQLTRRRPVTANKTPTLHNNIRIYSKVTFNYQVHPPSKTQPTSATSVVVTGRLWYGIGRVKHADRAET